MPVSFEAMGYFSICSEQEYTGYTATENLVFYISCEARVHREDNNYKNSCIMPVSFEAMGYSSICSEQEYTGYIATEKLVESFKSLVKQKYTGYTASENLVEFFNSIVKQEYTATSNWNFCPFFASCLFVYLVSCLITMSAVWLHPPPLNFWNRRDW